MLDWIVSQKNSILRNKIRIIKVQGNGKHYAQNKQKRKVDLFVQFAIWTRTYNQHIYSSVYTSHLKRLVSIMRVHTVQFHVPKRLLIMSIVSERFISVSIHFSGITYYSANCVCVLQCNAKRKSNSFTLHFMIYIPKNEICSWMFVWEDVDLYIQL